MRYIPSTDEDRRELLEEIGVDRVDALFEDIPAEIRERSKLEKWEAMSEIEIHRRMGELGGKNKSLSDLVCFRGAGAYDHYIPSAVKEIVGRSEFYTSYTPYQPEISQGTLQAIFEFQTMIADLAGMEASNASMYDGATSTAEAAIMAVTDTKRRKILVSRGTGPEVRSVMETYSRFRDIELVEVAMDEGTLSIEDLRSKVDKETAGVVVQSPNFFGIIEDLSGIKGAIEDKKVKFIVNTDLLSMGVLKSPGSQGADIVVGDAQSLGNGILFGGPYLGFMAVNKKLIRKMPGRIVGESIDTEGRVSYVLTLQAREQHIRRYKATSNICSNHGLNALAATVHMSLLGKKGLEEVANQCLQKAHYTMKKLTEGGRYRLKYDKPFFKEFLVESQGNPGDINRQLEERGILGGYPVGRDYDELSKGILLCVTEKRSRDEIDKLVECMEEM
ncbi:putative glycine dehydrogenase (decarboxylating) subunit 1 [Propionigenium maris DSM 9537]|uniref:Probable glycine dehydrogenase (decarboxylating) subunit 1 n=1 Tax=Propionigenium maris DSM 9537 TaxID=1123000 RepID=A0A9W6GPS8_9FUSO|nr:aminomethyl-transferring glycine dehydrogenase subunit GcvPA [Propionigenium maris]GLI57884.1 putative glycine dehydrogenase (decarboxylating) subunit 1 [Propionigenium maris DSM 9537]